MFDTKSHRDRAADLGARLKALRLQRNLTQDEVAEQAGVSRPTLGALENTGRGTLLTLVRVLYALGRERELEGLLAPDPPSVLAQAAVPAPPRRRARK